MNFAEFLKKLTDTIHLGKVPTDLVPGLVLTAAILLCIVNFSDYGNQPPNTQNSKSLGSLSNDFKKFDATRESLIDTISALDAQIAAPTTPKEAQENLKKKRDFQLQKWKFINEEREKLRAAHLDAQKKLSPINQLKTKLMPLTGIFVELTVFATLVGIILAQISGKIFYNGLFYTYFKEKHKDAFDILHPEDGHTDTYYRVKIEDKNYIETLPSLDTEYFRYLEIAMNMVLPFAALTLVLSAISLKESLSQCAICALPIALMGASIMLYRKVHPNAEQKFIKCCTFISIASTIFTLIVIVFQYNDSLLPIGLATLSGLVTLALYYNARVLYVGYFLKKADIMEAMSEKVSAETS